MFELAHADPLPGQRYEFLSFLLLEFGFGLCCDLLSCFPSLGCWQKAIFIELRKFGHFLLLRLGSGQGNNVFDFDIAALRLLHLLRLLLLHCFGGPWQGKLITDLHLAILFADHGQIEVSAFKPDRFFARREDRNCLRTTTTTTVRLLATLRTRLLIVGADVDMVRLRRKTLNELDATWWRLAQT